MSNSELIRDLTSATERFAVLLRAVSKPDAPAVGTWSVAETAAHVRAVAALNAQFASGDEPADDFRALFERALADTFATHAPFTDMGVEWARRDGFGALAPGIIEDATRLAVAVTEEPDREVVWLSGTKLPAAAVGAHMISELLVHGFDIARAARVRFAVPDGEASHFFETYIPPFVPAAKAAGFFDQERGDIGPVSWRLKLRGGSTFAYAYRDGDVQAVNAHDRGFDLTISARPASMLLVMYRRLSPAGRVWVWGRRPWRIARVMQVLQTP